MMDLNIDSLRLTQEDFQNLWHPEVDMTQAAADAQLKKALWGIQEWLESTGVDVYPGRALRRLILAAGMSKPEEH